MKKIILLGLLTTSSYGHYHTEALEPIGNRLGLSLLEVIDSLNKEGLFQYSSYDAPKAGATDASTYVHFQSYDHRKALCYSFGQDKCKFAILMLPLTELDSVVQVYSHYPSLGKQMWRGPHGRITLSVAIGEQSSRSDHKPHVQVIFDPRM